MISGGAIKMPQPTGLSIEGDLVLPKGYGFRRLTLEELQARDSLLGCLTIWERPRVRGPRRYVMGVDVSDGLGKDRSAIAVHRLGTIEEPEEQVALYVHDQIEPKVLAYVVDAIGRLYCDEDRYEALAAIECNNHGLSTQDTLQLHLGYGHFYRWEYLDAGDPKARYSTKIGWVTTPRTRPMLLDKLKAALTTLDPVTHQTELLIHSKILRDELADFQTETVLWEAEAARGAFDDTVLATAIAHYVAWRLQGGEQEPLSERRFRQHQLQQQREQAAAQIGQTRPDWRNTGCTLDEMNSLAGEGEESWDVNGPGDDRGTPTFLG